MSQKTIYHKTELDLGWPLEQFSIAHEQWNMLLISILYITKMLQKNACSLFPHPLLRLYPLCL